MSTREAAARNSRIYIYGPGEEVEVPADSATASAGPILNGLVLQLAEL